MHLRRAMLLFALVLGLTALAASIAPSQHSGGTTAAPVPPPGAESRTVSIAWSEPSPKPRVRRVAAGAHVVLTVASPSPASVTIPLLGRTETLTPSAPARFDLVIPRPGRYDVLLLPPAAAPTLAGAIVSR